MWASSTSNSSQTASSNDTTSKSTKCTSRTTPTSSSSFGLSQRYQTQNQSQWSSTCKLYSFICHMSHWFSTTRSLWNKNLPRYGFWSWKSNCRRWHSASSKIRYSRTISCVSTSESRSRYLWPCLERLRDWSFWSLRNWCMGICLLALWVYRGGCSTTYTSTSWLTLLKASKGLSMMLPRSETKMFGRWVFASWKL